jgi:hypothetical protein
MPISISSKKEFEDRIKNEKKDQVLIFHGNSSSLNRINRYNVIALATAVEKNKLIEVFTVNLDQVSLNPVDATTYQNGNEVICCTTVNEGVVMEKQVNPFETTLRMMVLNILV